MRKLTVFLQLSLDGCFASKNNDINWAHRNDREWKEFAAKNALTGGELLFGRVTYELMANYWPTPRARADNPGVVDGMNRMPKTVFSRTLETVAWSNTRIVKDGLIDEVQTMKRAAGPDITILGSASIVAQLASAKLVDEFQFVVVPVVLGEGRKVFEGVHEKLSLKLINARTFANGNVVLSYQPA